MFLEFGVSNFLTIWKRCRYLGMLTVQLCNRIPIDCFCHFQNFSKNRKINFTSSKFRSEVWATCSFNESKFSSIEVNELTRFSSKTENGALHIRDRESKVVSAECVICLRTHFFVCTTHLSFYEQGRRGTFQTILQNHKNMLR